MQLMTVLRSVVLAAVVCGWASPAWAEGDVRLEVDDRRIVRLFGDAADNGVEIVPGEGRNVYPLHPSLTRRARNLLFSR